MLLLSNGGDEGVLDAAVHGGVLWLYVYFWVWFLVSRFWFMVFSSRTPFPIFYFLSSIFHSPFSIFHFPLLKIKPTQNLTGVRHSTAQHGTFPSSHPSSPPLPLSPRTPARSFHFLHGYFTPAHQPAIFQPRVIQPPRCVHAHSHSPEFLKPIRQISSSSSIPPASTRLNST